VLVVSGHYEANADMMPTLRVIDVAAEPDTAAAASADVLAGMDLEQHTEQSAATPAAAAAAAPQAISEDLAPFVVAEGGEEQELVRQLSTRMSMRRGSIGTPLRRQFSKAA
jgi:hypothetical protein